MDTTSFFPSRTQNSRYTNHSVYESALTLARQFSSTLGNFEFRTKTRGAGARRRTERVYCATLANQNILAVRHTFWACRICMGNIFC